MAARDAWRGFTGTAWRSTVDVADFIRLNYTPYLGDAAFLVAATARAAKLWDSLGERLARERGIRYPLEGSAPPDGARLTRVRDQVAAEGLAVCQRALGRGCPVRAAVPGRR